MPVLEKIDGHKVRLAKEGLTSLYLNVIKSYLSFNYSKYGYDFRSKSMKYINQRYELYTEDDKYIYMYIGASLCLVNLVPDLELNFDNSGDIELLEKWKTIFNNHPYEDKGKDQLNITISLLDRKIGLANAYTGVGKGEIICSIIESFLEGKEGNVSLMVFNNQIKKELELRLKKYDILDKHKDRVKIINPKSLFRTKKYLSGELSSFIQNTRLMVVDEAHNISKLEEDFTFIKYLKEANPEYLYCLTATADKKEGFELNENTLKNSTSNVQACSLLSIAGPSVISLQLKTPIRIIKKKLSIVGKEEYELLMKRAKKDKLREIIHVSSSYTATTLKPKFAKIVKEIYDTYLSDGICIFPELGTIETGKSLSYNLHRAGLNVIYYSAKYVSYNGKELDQKKFNLDTLKKASEKKMYDILVTNIVGIEGIDLKNLNSIISVSGSSYGNFIQSVGRSARSSAVNLVLFTDKYNTYLNNKSRNKMKVAMSTLNVIDIIEI